MRKLMRNIILYIIIIFGSLSNLYSQPVRMEWFQKWNGKENKEDKSTGIVVDDEGNVYITGYTDMTGDNLDYVTIKYSPEGKMKWLKQYGTPRTVWGISMDQAHAIALDKDANVYVTGWSSGNVRTDYATIKYNSAGKQMWLTTYTGKSNLNDEAYWIALDNIGNVYVTGWSYGNLITSKDLLTTVKYNSLGKRKWIFTFDEKSNVITQPRHLKCDDAGNVYVVGGSADFSGGAFDYSIVKIDSSGGLKWAVTYDGPVNENDIAECVAIDHEGNVYVTGVSTTSKKKGKEVFATIKYSPLGEKKWEAIYSGPTDKYQAYATRIDLDAKGNLYVGGGVKQSTKSENIALVKYDPNGVQQWVSIYTGPESYDKIQDMVVAKSGNVYITGSSEGGSTDNDIITIKYDNTGNKSWEMRYNGPKDGNDYGAAITIDKNETVYVTGVVKAKKAKDDIITIKYVQNQPN